MTALPAELRQSWDATQLSWDATQRGWDATPMGEELGRNPAGGRGGEDLCGLQGAPPPCRLCSREGTSCSAGIRPVPAGFGVRVSSLLLSSVRSSLELSDTKVYEPQTRALRVSSFGFWSGFGFRVPVLGVGFRFMFRGEELGIGVSGLLIRVQDLGFRVQGPASSV